MGPALKFPYHLISPHRGSWLSKNLVAHSHHGICSDYHGACPASGRYVLRLLPGQLHDHLLRLFLNRLFLHLAGPDFRKNTNLIQEFLSPGRGGRQYNMVSAPLFISIHAVLLS